MARFRNIRPQDPSDRPSDGSGGDRIDSWVAIADYLRRDVKTVQRWERNSGLPVHRLTAGRGRPNVYAYRSELDAWLDARTSTESAARVEAEPVPPPPASPEETEEATEPRRFPLRTVGGVAAALAVAALLFWLRDSVLEAELSVDPPPAEQAFTYYLGNEDDAAISPDGRWMAYIWDGEEFSGGGDLYIQEIGSDVRRRLTRTPQTEIGPEWSPDGKRIAYRRVDPGSCEIVVIPVDGGPSQSILEREMCGGLDYLSWSPDGEFLAFSDLENRRVTITLYSFADGSLRAVNEPSQIPRTPVDQYPSLSPDGKRLAVTRIQEGDIRAIILGLDGEELGSFVTGAKGRHVWSADGESLIFTRRRTHAGELQRLRLADGVVTNLPYGSIESIDPTVRGDRLAYTRWRFVTGLRRVDLKDGKVVPGSDRVLVPSTSVDHSPEYSPDGSRLAFVSDRTGTEEVWVCDADGSAVRRLTSLDVHGTGSPRWSPDGEWIAFDSSVDTGHDTAILVVSSLGGDPRRLTSGNPVTRVPGWSADGRWVYFASRPSVPATIWKAPAEGGEAVPVTAAPGFEPRETPDGRTMFFARNTRALGLWARDLETGREAPVEALAEAGYHRYWSLTRKALYFVAGDGDPSDGAPFEIKRYDLGSGLVTDVGTIDRPLVDGPSGLTVAPDESSLVYATVELDDRDIMLVEGFE